MVQLRDDLLAGRDHLAEYLCKSGHVLLRAVVARYRNRRSRYLATTPRSTWLFLQRYEAR